MKERIYTVIEQLKKTREILSQAEFAEKLGINPSQISEMLNGKRPISERTIHKIAQTFPNISEEWIKVGDGDMLKGEAMSTQVAIQTNKLDKVVALKAMIADIQQNSKRGDKIRLIPLMNIDAVGGYGNDICDTAECAEELIPIKGARDNSICIPVSGDSMMPIFNPGDLVVIDEVVEWLVFLEMGQYYVIILKDSRRLIKKVTYSEVDRNLNFLLVSENLNYPPVELPKNIVQRVFIVTQKHQKLTL